MIILDISTQILMEKDRLLPFKIWSLKVALYGYYLRTRIPEYSKYGLQKWIYFYISEKGKIISDQLQSEPAQLLSSLMASSKFALLCSLFQRDNNNNGSADQLKKMFNKISQTVKKQFDYSILIEPILKGDRSIFDKILEDQDYSNKIHKQLVKEKQNLFNAAELAGSSYDIEAMLLRIKLFISSEIEECEQEIKKMVQRFISNIECKDSYQEINALLSKDSYTMLEQALLSPKNMKNILYLILLVHQAYYHFSSNNICQVQFQSKVHRYCKGQLYQLVKQELLAQDQRSKNYIFITTFNQVAKTSEMIVNSHLVVSEQITVIFEGSYRTITVTHPLPNKLIIKHQLSIEGQIDAIQIDDKLHIYHIYEYIQFWISITGQQRSELYCFRGDKTIKQCKQQLQLKLKMPAASQIWRIDQEYLDQHQPIYQLKYIEDHFKIIIDKRQSLEEYGFTELLPISLQTFKRFTFEDNQYFLEKIGSQEQSKYPMKSYQLFFRQLCLRYIFSYIKRRCLISSSIEQIKALIHKHPFPQIASSKLWRPLKSSKCINYFNDTFLIYHLINSADQRLKIELLRQLKQNYPVPIYLLREGKSYFLYKQHYWIHSKAFNIISMSFQAEAVDGKSSLLNYFFNTNFEKRQGLSRVCSQNIQIAYNIHQNEDFCINLIDVCGQIEQSIKIQLARSCNFLLIHSKFEDSRSAESKILKIENWIEDAGLKIPFIIFLRDASQEEVESYKFKMNQTRKSKLKYLSIPIPNPRQQAQSRDKYQMDFQNASYHIHDLIKEIYVCQKDNLWVFSRFLASKNQRQSQLNQILQMIDKQTLNICQIINTHEEIFHLKMKMPCTVTQRQIQQLKNHALEVGLTQIIKKILIYCNQNKEIIGQIIYKIKTFLLFKKNQICNIFYSAQDKQNKIEKKNCLIYALKKIINSKMIVLSNKQRQRHNQLLAQMQVQAEMETTLKNLKKLFYGQLSSRFFSIELFWRELIYMFKFDHNYQFIMNGKKVRLEEELVNFGRKLILNSEAFELINGDILDLPKQFLIKVFAGFEEKSVIVIGIVGVQSSGKSTILNSVFGCDFMSSVGRCTKGVYATYYEVSNKQKLNFDSVIVLDTQGLMSVYKNQRYCNRNNFDLKILLFCTRICDIVIFNNRGDYTKDCKQLLEPTFDSEFAVSSDLPNFFFTINMNDKENRTQKNQFQQICQSITKNNPSAKQFLQSQNILSLPSAFNQENVEMKRSKYFKARRVPSNEFAMRTASLNKRLLQLVLKRISKQGYNIRKLDRLIIELHQRWFTLNNYEILTKYTDKQKKILSGRVEEWRTKQQHDIFNMLKQEKLKYEKWKENQGNFLIQQYIQTNKKQQQSHINIEPLLQQKKECLVKIDKFASQYIINFKQFILNGRLYSQFQNQLKVFIDNEERNAKAKMQMKKTVMEEIFKQQYVRIDMKIASNSEKEAVKLEKLASQCSILLQNGNECNLNERFDVYWTERQDKFKQQLKRQVKAQDIYRRYQGIYNKYLSIQRKENKIYRLKAADEHIKDYSQTLQQYRQHLTQSFQHKFSEYEALMEENKKQWLFRLQKQGCFSNKLVYLNMNDFYEPRVMDKYIRVKERFLNEALNRQNLNIYLKNMLEKERRIQALIGSLCDGLDYLGVQVEYSQMAFYVNQLLIHQYWSHSFSIKDQLQIYQVKTAHNKYIYNKKLICRRYSVKEPFFVYIAQFIIITPQQVLKVKMQLKQNRTLRMRSIFNFDGPNQDLSEILYYENQKKQFYRNLPTFSEQFFTDHRHLFEENKKRLNKLQTVTMIVKTMINNYIAHLPKYNLELHQYLLQFNKRTSAQLKQILNKDLSNINLRIEQQSDIFHSITLRKSEKSLKKFISRQNLDRMLSNKFGPFWNTAKLKSSYLMEQEKSKKKHVVGQLKIVEYHMKHQFDQKEFFQKYRDGDQQYLVEHSHREFLQLVFAHMKQRHIFRSIISKIIKIVEEVELQVTQLDQKILCVIQRVDEIIKDFNEDLLQIGQKLLYDFEIEIHSWAFHYFWKFKQSIFWDKMESEIFKGSKQSQWKKFLALINKNSEIAINECYAAQFVEMYIKFMNQLFQESLEKKSQELRSGYMKMIIQKQTFQKAESQITKSLLKRHQETNKAIATKQIKQLKLQIMDYFQDKRKTMRKYYMHFETPLIEQFKKGYQLQRVNSKKCLEQLKICFDHILEKIQVNNPGYQSLSTPMLNYFLKEQLISSTYQQSLKKILNKQFIKQHLKSIRFKDLPLFIRYVKENLNQKDITFPFWASKDQRIKKFQHFIHLKLCTSICPCCRNLCSLNINQFPSHEIHKCTDHYFRAAGSIFIKTNEVEETYLPSYYRCDQVKDSDIFQRNNVSITWNQFKKQNEKWDFKARRDPDWIKSMHALWDIAGENICKSYKKDYIPYDPSYKGPSALVDYIFALDESGSMTGQKWTNLKQALNGDLDWLKNNFPKSLVSIIKFNETVDPVITPRTAQKINILELTQKGGGTSFAPIFKKIHDFSHQIKNNHMVVIFLTDGLASYPTKEIQNLIKVKNDYKRANLEFIFITIYISDIKSKPEPEVLMKIRDALQGQYKEVKDTTKIGSVLREMQLKVVSRIQVSDSFRGFQRNQE